MVNGYVDIHSHVLWRMDDGSRSVEETLDLCCLAEETGTSQLFLTPHLMYWEAVEELFDTRNMKVERLSELLEAEEIDLKLHKGFEILCDDDIFDIKHFAPYTLADSRYILIEFDFFKTNLEDVTSWCNYLLSFGLVPVIAHPERYEFLLLNEEGIDILSRKGVLFQLNSGSAAGMFGEEVQAFAEKMINRGYADFIGSDAHSFNMRNTDMDFCFNNYSEEVNMDLLERAYSTNALKLIKDKEINPERLCYFAEK